MAFGLSLGLAKIQPPPARLVHNSTQYGTYGTVAAYNKRVEQLRRFKAEAEEKKAARHSKLAARNAIREKLGLDLVDLPEAWPSVMHHELRRMDAQAEQERRAQKRWWRTNWARVRRMFSWLGEMST